MRTEALSAGGYVAVFVVVVIVAVLLLVGGITGLVLTRKGRRR